MNGKKAKLLRRVLAMRRAGQPLHPADLASIQAAADFRAHHVARLAPKPVRERKHKRKAAQRPTWPRSKDQRQQSRPLIVVRPMSRLAGAMRAANPPGKDGTRELTPLQREALRSLRNAPKHQVDAALPRWA